VVTVTGGSNKRVSLAALIATRPGHPARMIYRTRTSRGKDQRKGFTETDYARFLDAAHQQLGGPLVVVWDGLNTHVSSAMRELIAVRSWLRGLPAPAVRQRAESGGTGLVELETVAGQPHQAGHRPADRAGQDPAQADAVPAQPPQRLPGQDQARPRNFHN